METGTFEWALVLARSGYRVRRNLRDAAGLLHWRRVVYVGSETGTAYALWPSGFLHEYEPTPDDLRAKDWDIAK